jgi:hypothetical protein
MNDLDPLATTMWRTLKKMVWALFLIGLVIQNCHQ